jgi:beta-lactamase class A
MVSSDPPTPTPKLPPPASHPVSSSHPPVRRPTVRPRTVVDAQVRKLATRLPAGGVSVAALNTRTGARYSFGAASGMRTGSVYKLFVLETLLLQHQDSGTDLSDYEMSKATPMIEQSDNVAAYQLFEDIGSNDGLNAAAPRLGLHHTVPGQADPAVTTTSAQDYLALLEDLVRNGPLDSDSRSYALGLMRNVESDQRWGVGVVADPGTTFANKNGWLSVDNSNGEGESDNDRWLVNSVGIVTVHGQQVLIAAFTQHGDSYETGVRLVESLVKTITPAVVAH